MSTSKIMTFLACAGLAALTACSAASAPCLAARQGVGGYGVEFVRQGPAPAGCANIPVTQFHVDPDNGLTAEPALTGPSSPEVWFDGWLTELYKSGQTADSQSVLNVASNVSVIQGNGFGGNTPPFPNVGQALFPPDPGADGNCTVNDVSAMTDTGFTFVGAAEDGLTYKINSITFLGGTEFQGFMFTADVDITFGTCTAKYTAHGLAPNVYIGFLNANANTCADTATDCDPNADLNANPPRSLGSGYNPKFKIECRTDLGAAFVNPGGEGVCFAPAGATFPWLQ
jgi:hypothetical protein